MAAEPADHQTTTEEAAEAGTERQRGRRAKSRATRAAKESRPAPDQGREPAAEAAPVEGAAATAPEPVGESVAEPMAALAAPVAAAVQATQALAAAPAVPPQVGAVAPRWPAPALRAGHAALESGLRLQRETLSFASAQAARNWRAGQALARCGSLPAALAVQRDLVEQTVAHGSAWLGALSRLAAEVARAAMPPLDRR